jgi:hypothetical protein
MKPEEMFPVDPKTEAEEKPPFTFDTFREPDNNVPAWMYRKTEELSPGEAVKLFTPAPQDALQPIYKECDQVEGAAFVKKLGQIFPQVRMPKPRKQGWARKLAMIFAERVLDMVPRAPAEYALARLKAEVDVRIGHGVEETRIAMARHFRDLAKKIEGSIVPGVKAPVREGKDFRGDRVLAVWTREGEPTEEPKF